MSFQSWPCRHVVHGRRFILILQASMCLVAALLAELEHNEGFGLCKPSESMFWSKSMLFEIWDFASSLQTEHSSDNSSIGKAKQRDYEASKGSTSIQGFSSAVFRPLPQDLILGLCGFDLLDVASLDLSAAFFIGFSIILARTNNQAICGNLSLGHSLYMQTAMSSYWITNLTKGSAWYMPWVFWFTEWSFFGTSTICLGPWGCLVVLLLVMLFFASPASRCVSCVCENRCIHVSTYDSSHLVAVPLTSIARYRERAGSAFAMLATLRGLASIGGMLLMPTISGSWGKGPPPFAGHFWWMAVPCSFWYSYRLQTDLVFQCLVLN